MSDSSAALTFWQRGVYNYEYLEPASSAARTRALAIYQTILEAVSVPVSPCPSAVPPSAPHLLLSLFRTQKNNLS
jgi:hypothetical protein